MKFMHIQHRPNFFTFLACVALLLSPMDSDAQLDRLINRTTSKLSREIERMAVEKISDVIAEKAAQRIESEFDKLLMAAMEEDSATYDRDSAYYEMGSRYAAFLDGLNDAADLPESYTFDLDILYEMSQNDDDPENIRYYFSRSEPIFGMQTATSAEDWQFIVIDVGNDVTVMYRHEGDKKTAQAIPNMMKLAGGLAKSTNENLEEEFDYDVRKTGKKERIAGYRCEHWEGSNNQDKRFEAYMTRDLEVDWKSTMGEVMQNFSGSSAFQENWEGMEGMVLKSMSFEEGEQISSMEAKEIGRKSFTVVNSEYSFGQN